MVKRAHVSTSGSFDEAAAVNANNRVHCSSFIRRTRGRYMCSLYHLRSGRILSSRVKLLTGRAGMSRHTTMGTKF
jgi:hypothetical protein